MMFLLPTYAMGSCLGVQTNELGSLTIEVSSFVAGISPLASPEQRTLGDCAAQALSDRFGRLVDQEVQPGILLKNFLAGGPERSIDRTVIVRNLIGFLFQTYDATAGLIGNSVHLLGQNEALHRRLQSGDSPLRQFVWEVMRFDPPVQNTRRFVAEDVRLGDFTIGAGEQVLLLLAAANRDPSEFSNPHNFDLDRIALWHLGLGAEVMNVQENLRQSRSRARLCIICSIARSLCRKFHKSLHTAHPQILGYPFTDPLHGGRVFEHLPGMRMVR